MTQSQILEALASGESVFFASKRYKVIAENGRLYTKDVYNEYYIGLAVSEYEHCFVG